MRALMLLERPFSKTNTSRVIGGLRFYGTPRFLDNCIKAVNEELPKYDNDLRECLINRTIHFSFLEVERPYMSSPTTGVFLVPEPVWRNGSEGICQFIVLAYVQTKITGTGFIAATNKILTNKYIRNASKDKMIAWITEKNFPSHWLAGYMEKNEATNAGEMPTQR